MAVDAASVLAALPQTQCTRCGYPDCAEYANAIAVDEAAINQCPPGGAQGIERLADLTRRPVVPLNPANGKETSRLMAVIDEDWCIGCTLCIEACPTDAIVGSNKRMHTVIERYCTGCELCVPVCPVDCIALENVTGDATGWSAWSQSQADQARERYASSVSRRIRDETENTLRLEKKAVEKLVDLPALVQDADAQAMDRKRAVIEAAIKRSRAQRDAK